MKKTTKELRIAHRGIEQYSNGEAAAPGVASELVNMREREQALEVVGDPALIAQLEEGDRVLLIDDDRTLILRGNNVVWNGTVLLTAGCSVLNAHRVGQLLVVITEQGNELLRRTASGYTRLAIADALPQIHLSATEQQSLSSTVPDYEFAEPYTTWQAPLASEDVRALTKLVRNAVATLQSNATAQGRYMGVMLARYGVRLWDDSYLWLSQPVMLGNAMMRSSYRTTTNVTTSNNRYSGVESFSISLDSYRLGISITSGIANEWRDLVKAIDVMVSPAATVVDTLSNIDYRCVVTTSSGTRRYLLEVGPKARSANAITQQVLNDDWQVVATTSVLDGSRFEGVNTAMSSQQVVPGRRCDVVMSRLIEPRIVTQAQQAAVMEMITQRMVGSVSMEHNGRLYQAPQSLCLKNPWTMLPWLDGTLTAGTANATLQVTLNTGEGTATLSSSMECPCTASALNAFIAFPDVRATHIAIAIGNKKWESDLWPMDGMGIAVSINSSLSANVLTTGTIPSGGSSQIELASSGTVTVSGVGNPLVTQWKATVSGHSIRGLAAACRPIYSGGFGRYPIYLFTDDGIMALPQRSNGTFVEPRLISEVVLASDAHPPVSGGDSVWFVSMHSVLCSLCGSTVKRMVNSIETTAQMAWNDRERELWIASNDGSVKVLMSSGRTYRRSEAVSSLYSDTRHTLAVTSTGALLDLTRESPVIKNVEYQSQPFELDTWMRSRVNRIIWNVFTSEPALATHNGEVTLTVRGERGASCHGYVISQASVTGVIAAPLSRPVVAPPSRTLRLAIAGTLPTATLILPTYLDYDVLTQRTRQVLSQEEEDLPYSLL